MFFRHLTSLSRKYGRIPRRALERANLREMSSGKYGRLHVIRTLDPNKFAEKNQQRLHIGDLQSFRPDVWLVKKASLVVAPRLEYDVPQTKGSGIIPPYPPGMKAFLYYSIPPEKPRIAGELRLRVTSSKSASFQSGSDLLLANGRPWTRPLFSLAKSYIPLYEKLREDRLIPDDLDIALSNLPSEKYTYRRSHFLYTLKDTFIVDFSAINLVFNVFTEHGLERIRFEKIFSENRIGYIGRTPYTGSALIRLERSTLPEHTDTRTIVLRFVKIITPVKCVILNYDGYICFPKEGELYRRSRNSIKSDTPVWSVNIDESIGANPRGLRLVWDV